MKYHDSKTSLTFLEPGYFGHFRNVKKVQKFKHSFEKIAFLSIFRPFFAFGQPVRHQPQQILICYCIFMNLKLMRLKWDAELQVGVQHSRGGSNFIGGDWPKLAF